MIFSLEILTRQMRQKHGDNGTRPANISPYLLHELLCIEPDKNKFLKLVLSKILFKLSLIISKHIHNESMLLSVVLLS